MTMDRATGVQTEASDRLFARICGSIGDRLDIDPTTLRALQTIAARSPSSRQQPTARSVADWVFSLQHATPPPSGIGAGSRARIRASLSNVFDRNADADIGAFEVEYCDPGDGTAVVLECAPLRYQGRPLRVCPDAVFRHRATGVRIICEYKLPSPGVRIPSAGWPSLAMQLWCYGWAVPWQNASRVLLCGALFDVGSDGPALLPIMPRTEKLSLSFQSACATLFRAWGGTIHPEAATGAARRMLAAIA